MPNFTKMMTRETRSAPVVWVPHVLNSTSSGYHSHSHGHGREPLRPIGGRRPITGDRNRTAYYGEYSSDANTKVFIVDYKRGCGVLGCALMFTLVQLAIGALNMGALIYAISVGDLHGILCSVAFHLLSAEAILAMSFKNGWSLLMGYDNRTMCHTVLHISCIIFAITGMTIKLLGSGVSSSAHCVTGLVTAALALLAIILGPIGLFRKSDLLKMIHMFLGLCTFLSASICFGLGLFKLKFEDWCKSNHDSIKWVMLALIIYIALVMVVLVVCKAANVDMLRAERRHR